MAERKGYCFIGTNLNANDAFLVRADLIQYIPETIRNNPISYEVRSRESRDKDGKLTYISSASDKLELIADKTMIDLDSMPHSEKTIREILDFKIFYKEICIDDYCNRRSRLYRKLCSQDTK